MYIFLSWILFSIKMYLSSANFRGWFRLMSKSCKTFNTIMPTCLSNLCCFKFHCWRGGGVQYDPPPKMTPRAQSSNWIANKWHVSVQTCTIYICDGKALQWDTCSSWCALSRNSERNTERTISLLISLINKFNSTY